MIDIPPSGYDLDGSSDHANALQSRYKARSDEAATLPNALLDLAYGAHERQRLDIFPADPGAPVLVFFHGGYWKAGSKDSRRYAAIPWTERNVTWVAVNYRLVPANTLEDATEDARNALIWIVKNANRLGINGNAIHVSGNSAGGHLAAMVGAAGWPGRPNIQSLTVVSALCDLVPLLDASPNDWLTLDAPRARALSPQNHLPPVDLPVLVAVGGAETEAFKFQSTTYADLLRAAGNPVLYLETKGEDHFEIIGGFGDPTSELFPEIKHLIDR